MISDSNPDTNYFTVQIQLHFDGFGTTKYSQKPNPTRALLHLCCKLPNSRLSRPLSRPDAFTAVAAAMPLILASTCCKAIFRSLFGPSRRDLACCQRIPIHIFYRRDLEIDGMILMKCEKPLCGGWMRISTATPVNAKGLVS